MKKKDIIKALASFNDEDNLMMRDHTLLHEFRRICGKGQYAMPYTCVLEPGHAGDCYCACKNVHFTPDQPTNNA